MNLRTTTVGPDTETGPGAHESTPASQPRTRRQQLDLAHLDEIARRAQRREARRASLLAMSRRRPVAALTALTAAAAVVAGSLMVAVGGDALAAPNLVVNGGFENGTTGWSISSPGKLSTTIGRTSAHAGLITNAGTVAKTIALNDRRNTVRSTVKGQTYHAVAYVRAVRSTQSVSLRVMEYNGTSLKGQLRKNLWLTDLRWHVIALDYTAATDGAMLDLNVVDWKMPAKAQLAVDDIELVALTADAPAAAPVAPTASPEASLSPEPAPSVTSEAPTPEPTTASPTPVASSPEPTPTTTTADPAPTGWTLAWSDEFDGSAVDTGKWNVRNNTALSYDLAYLTKNNVTVRDGSLVITAKKEALGGRAYTSGYLDTIGKMSRTYGRFEMRAKLPTAAGTSKGMWPAFWLRPDDGGLGEIDIMEAVGPTGSYTDTMTSQTIWYDYNNTYPREGHADKMPAPQVTADWHTYALEWTPTAMRWYVDDRLVYTRTTTTTPWYTKAFSRNFNIRLNLQVGGSWPGSPDSTTVLPQNYLVDYVRVYNAS